MTVEMLRNFFLWCTIINYAIIFLWFILYVIFGDLLYRLHSRLFEITRERFNGLMYQGMMIYKLGIMLFSLVPYIVLLIIK